MTSSESKPEEKEDLNAPWFGPMSLNQFLAIAKLATARHYDWEKYDVKQILTGVFQQVPSIRNGNSSSQYAHMEIPFRHKNGTYDDYGFVLNIFDDGYVSYENGSSVQMRFENPLEVYKMVNDIFGKKDEEPK